MACIPTTTKQPHGVRFVVPEGAKLVKDSSSGYASAYVSEDGRWTVDRRYGYWSLHLGSSGEIYNPETLREAQEYVLDDRMYEFVPDKIEADGQTLNTTIVMRNLHGTLVDARGSDWDGLEQPKQIDEYLTRLEQSIEEFNMYKYKFKELDEFYGEKLCRGNLATARKLAKALKTMLKGMGRR